MKFTKLIMLASVVSLACACEKEMPAETVPAPDQAKETRVSTQMLSFSSIEEMGQQINELGAMDEVALSAWYAAHNFESQSDAVYRVAAEIEDAKTLAEAEAIKASYAPYFLFNENPDDEESFNPYIRNENPDYAYVCNINGDVVIGGQVINFNTISDVKDTHEYQLTHETLTRTVEQSRNYLKSTVGKHKFWAEGRFEPKDDFVKVEFTAHRKGTFGWNKIKQNYHLRNGRSSYPNTWELFESIGYELINGSKDFWTGTLNPHRLKNVGRIAAGKTASFSMMVYTAGTLQAGEGRLDLYFTSAR